MTMFEAVPSDTIYSTPDLHHHGYNKKFKMIILEEIATTIILKWD